MSKSKLDSFLESCTEARLKRTLDVLNDPAIGHLVASETLAPIVDVSEASVRRWRRAAGIALAEKTPEVPKILIWDIESSPILGYTWGLWEQNVIHVVNDWKLLTVSWTWYGSNEYHAKQLCDFKGYKKGSLDDSELALFVRNLLNEADYSVAHNGNAFDVKKVNAKFAEHSIIPPAPHTQIDTLMIARRNMKMSSNKLDSLGTIFGVGRKIKHSGFDLWLRCMAGEKTAWEEMREYAIQDVVLLEQVFQKLLPWVKGLNYGLFIEGQVCHNCGSTNLRQEGQYKTQTTSKPAFACIDCGSWSKGKKA